MDAVGRAQNLLGPKGVKTRQRLLEAAETLLATTSAVSLTAAAVTRLAGVSPPTFYVYFNDINDLVYQLALSVNDNLEAIVAVLREWREANLAPRKGAQAFVNAFRRHWNDHRTILSIRNMEADRGDLRFLRMRERAGSTIIVELADHIANHDAKLSRKDALARATVIFAAIERLVATELLYPPPEPGMPSRDDLVEAAIIILASLIAPS